MSQQRFAVIVLLAACLGLAVLAGMRAHAQPPKDEPAQPETDQPATPPPAAPVDQAELEREFEETMSGSRLVGYFTTDGQEEEKGLKEESYRLKKVQKLERGDYWLFEFQYGGENAPTIPLTLQMKWAGDTPMITLTDAVVPVLGTYSARVLFYRGEYAGTWSAPDHAGKLFGRIVRDEPTPDEPKPEPAPK
ncbi:MAG: hypothetical protein WD847_14290 [Pirellulales bacterium]